FLAGAGAKDNQVIGNYIGTDIDGLTRVPNAGDGVRIAQGSANKIGLAMAAQGNAPGNLISGNQANGIQFLAGATQNLVQSNYIGTDKNGTAYLENGEDGVHIVDSPKNVVGGLTANPGSPPGNLISGNKDDGVEINGSDARFNLVQGNFIG